VYQEKNQKNIQLKFFYFRKGKKINSKSESSFLILWFWQNCCLDRKKIQNHGKLDFFKKIIFYSAF